MAYKTNVKLEVFSSEGDLIKVLVNEEKEAGTYKAEFNIAVIKDKSLKNENFYYQIRAGDYKSKKKMLILK